MNKIWNSTFSSVFLAEQYWPLTGKKIEREHRKHGPYCGSDLTVAEMEIFLMDKHMAKRPVLIYSLSAEIYKYSKSNLNSTIFMNQLKDP